MADDLGRHRIRVNPNGERTLIFSRLACSMDDALDVHADVCRGGLLVHYEAPAGLMKSAPHGSTDAWNPASR